MGLHRAAIDGDRAASTTITAADTCAIPSAMGLHRAAIDGDRAAIAMETSADTCATTITMGIHYATMDDNLANCRCPADARNIITSSFQPSGLFSFALGEDVQRVVSSHINPILGLQRRAITENEVHRALDFDAVADFNVA